MEASFRAAMASISLRDTNDEKKEGPYHEEEGKYHKSSSLAVPFADQSGTCIRRTECEAVYDSVFSTFPSHHGKQVSRRARDELGLIASSLVYGEIEFQSLYCTLEKIRLKYGIEHGVMQQAGKGVFYDLGSGAGKPCVAAACSFGFQKCVGLECVQALVDISKEVAHVYRKHCPDGPAVEFYCADVTDPKAYDWTTDATVVFANSTCFDDALMAAIADRAHHLPKGAFFVTLTRKLPCSSFEVCESQLHQMSWGGATVFIQHKIEHPVASACSS